jgi:hypothetical protein
LVQTTNDVGNHVGNEETRKAFEREAVGTRPQAFLDGAYGAFDFPNVTIGGDNVHDDRQQRRTEALELVIALNVTDRKAAVTIDAKDCL